MAAAANGSLKVVKRILEYGCTNINEKMVNTRSHVTHDAAKSGNIEIMKVVIVLFFLSFCFVVVRVVCCFFCFFVGGGCFFVVVNFSYFFVGDGWR